ncbi:MAG: hypothetical protein M1825_005722 [Sarcosagium campestre]|nr:MAG: hypothetical protein M1825_005722 [Sarcosagium campestre]
MKDASEDEQEEDLILPASRRTRDDQPLRRPKSEREEGLRKMMEDDDDEAMIDPPVSSEEESQGSPAIETSPIAVAQPEREKSEEPVVTVSNGRRRGKRKIMKKLTVKDEEGFLVTREEPVWESFSEDEPLLASKVKATSVAAKGAKKAGAKVGQGNITSFFAKK